MESLISLFATFGLGAFDPIALLAFVLAVWALLLVVVAALKRSDSDHGEVERLRRRIDALEQQISRLESGPTEVKKKPEKQPRVTSGAESGASMHSGLSKSRSALFGRLGELFGASSKLDSETSERFEELLISSDMGVATSQLLLGQAKEQLSDEANLSADRVKLFLRDSIEEILRDPAPAAISPNGVDGQPKIVLVVGVNGAGKTTTIGKLASSLSAQGAKVMLAACDTFRAAAVEQLQIWGERVGAPVVVDEEGAKPTTVAYKAVHQAQEQNVDVLIVDTAGRLHTRSNLMKELSAVSSMISREQGGAPHETILVVDGSSGQNALEQARQFNEATGLTGVVITKLDGTPKGGIVVAIRKELGVPIRYIGIGEGVDDLREFDAAEFCEALLSGENNRELQGAQKKYRTARRRRRA